MGVFAEVAVDSPIGGDHTYSYAVPSDMALEVGHAVWAPFGRRVLPGLVFDITDAPQVPEVRDIAGFIDPRPALRRDQVALARWIAEYYRAPLYAAAALMMPPGLERHMVTLVELSSEASPDTPLDAMEERLLRMLQRRSPLRLRDVQRTLGKAAGRRVVDGLQKKGLVSTMVVPEPPRVRPKTVRLLRLAVDEAGAKDALSGLPRRAFRQRSLLELMLAVQGPVAYTEAVRLCGRGAVTALLKLGLLVVETVEVRRDPLAHRPPPSPSSAPRLTPAQAEAWREIEMALREDGSDSRPKVFLLHGVTGSGKTELYLQALRAVVSEGKKGIVLVPEIALTPQIIDRFRSRFPGRVGVLHSQLSPGEHFDEWRQARDGAYDVVIGPRGAVFAPQRPLGLICLDEEHEPTYKQDAQAPRYHARDVALKLADLTGAVVILGSATPSIESYRRAERGEFRLLRLPERIAGGGAPLPWVDVVDLREELKAGHRGLFSRALIEGMEAALESGDQVILFLNRRGTATLIQCRRCGLVMRCRSCDVSLTYHTTDDCLLCHQCNRRVPVPNTCPNCGSPAVRFRGAGTQRVEAEVARLFPGARILRWDRDVTRGRHSHEEILDRFVGYQADVLVGTQMVAKGLDLPRVTLVGIVNADVGLYIPDFRAAERAFQLITQVAGRAGRGGRPGRVVLQTYSPQHYAITAAAQHDYEAFYHQELALRRECRNPPFSRLIGLLYTATNVEACQKETQRLRHVLEARQSERGLDDIEILGPAPAFVGRRRGRYRWQLVLRGYSPHSLLDGVQFPRGWTVDVDPASIL